jgi:hypothetical protein
VIWEKGCDVEEGCDMQEGDMKAKDERRKAQDETKREYRSISYQAPLTEKTSGK